MELSYADYDIQVKVAAVQAAPVWFDADATIEKACRIIEEAASNGAKLIGFPELFVSGYPWWLQVGDPLWAGQFYKSTYASSMSLGDARMQKLMEAARKNDIYVVIGYAQLDKSSLYMAQVFISDEGTILANRKKLKPTHVERCVYGEGDGSDIRVVQTPIGRIGALQCWEHYQAPEIFAMSLLHEQIHIASWPSHDVFQNHGYSYPDTIEANKNASSMYAQLTQSFVIASTTLIDEDAHKKWRLDEEQKSYLPIGGGWASIFGPEGTELTRDQRIPSDQEGIVYADIDLTDILQYKTYRDPTGQYSRPDIFTLRVNRKKNSLGDFVGENDPQSWQEELAGINDDALKRYEENGIGVEGND